MLHTQQRHELRAGAVGSSTGLPLQINFAAAAGPAWVLGEALVAAAILAVLHDAAPDALVGNADAELPAMGALAFLCILRGGNNHGVRCICNKKYKNVERSRMDVCGR